jgi:8-oxo-dGTP pyrophosphatase MutT (NUDIX family)
LFREIKEELGITELEIVKLIRVWHLFRGSEKVDNELIGITYHCQTLSDRVVLSNEHQAYAWVMPQEAMNLIKVEGIRKDVEVFTLLP